MFYHRTTQINGHCCSVPVTLCLVLLQFLPFRFRIANRLCGNKIQCPSNHKVVVPFLCCSLYIPDPTNLTRPQGIQSKLLLLLLYIPIKATAIPASIYYRYVFVDCRRIVPGRLVCGGDDWKHLKRRGSSAAVSMPLDAKRFVNHIGMQMMTEYLYLSAMNSRWAPIPLPSPPLLLLIVVVSLAGGSLGGGLRASPALIN